MHYTKKINEEYNKALNYFHNNNIDGAQEILEELYKHNIQNTKINELLAYVYGKKGKKDKSLDFLIKACLDINCSAEANYYLGLAFLNSNQLELAINNFEIALKKGGNFIEGLINLGVAKVRLNDKNGALISFSKALSIQENNITCLLNMGKLYIDLLRYKESLPFFDKVISINNNCSEAYLEKANALYNLNEFHKSLEYYDKYINFNLNDYLPFFNKGVIYRQIGKYDDAIDCLQIAHNLDPTNNKTINEIALLLIDYQKYDAARKFLELGFCNEQNNTELLCTLGLLHHAQNNFQSALSIYNNLLEKSENLILVLIRKGKLLSENFEIELAQDCFNKVLLIDPKNIQAKIGMGQILNYKSDYLNAIKYFKDVLEIDPNNFEANLDISYSYFHNKNFTLGWDHYECRWLNKNLASPKLETKKPTWNGEKNFNKLYIWYEQGLGEQILCSSVFNHLNKFEGEIIISLPSKMIPLYKRSYPKIIFTTDLCCNEIEFDYQISIFGLMRLYVSSFELIGIANSSKLHINKNMKNIIIQKYKKKDKKICGVSWISYNSSIGKNKTISINQIKQILHNKNYDFINLQHGVLKEDLSNIELKFVKEINLYDDIDGVASLISMCDVIVTISNTIAHLAGSLNIKTYLLLPYGRGRLWYWLESNGKSAFYPSITIFNQTSSGDWVKPIKMVNDLLCAN